ELAGAVHRRRLQREHDAAIVQESQPVLGRRPEQMPAQLLQPGAIRGRCVDVGVGIEAREVRVARVSAAHGSRAARGAVAEEGAMKTGLAFGPANFSPPNFSPLTPVGYLPRRC